MQQGRKVHVFTTKEYYHGSGYDLHKYVFDAETYQLVQSGLEALDGTYSATVDYLNFDLLSLDQKDKIFDPDSYGFILNSAGNQNLDVWAFPEGCYDFYGKPLSASESETLLKSVPEDYYLNAINKFLAPPEDGPLEVMIEE